jgi:hypothetical protein
VKVINKKFTFSSNVFRRIMNEWGFITIFEQKNNVTSKYKDIKFNDDSIEIHFEREAHKLDLNDIAKLINCKFALIGIDEKENKIICGN